MDLNKACMLLKETRQSLTKERNKVSILKTKIKLQIGFPGISFRRLLKYEAVHAVTKGHLNRPKRRKTRLIVGQCP